MKRYSLDQMRKLGYNVSPQGVVTDPEDGAMVDAFGRVQHADPKFNPFEYFAEEKERADAGREADRKAVAAKEAHQARTGANRKWQPKPIKPPADLRGATTDGPINIPEAVGCDPVAAKPKAKPNFNKRAKEFMEGQGYIYTRTEHYDAIAGVHRDLFGVFDGIAFGIGTGVVGVQITSDSNVSARRKKIQAWKDFARWCESGNKAVIIGYSLERGRWVPTVHNVEPKVSEAVA